MERQTLRHELADLERAIETVPDTLGSARQAMAGAGRVAAAISAIGQHAALDRLTGRVLATLLRDRWAFGANGARVKRRLRVRIAGVRLRAGLRMLWRLRRRIIAFVLVAGVAGWIAINIETLIGLALAALEWIEALRSGQGAVAAPAGGGP